MFTIFTTELIDFYSKYVQNFWKNTTVNGQKNSSMYSCAKWTFQAFNLIKLLLVNIIIQLKSTKDNHRILSFSFNFEGS